MFECEREYGEKSAYGAGIRAFWATFTPAICTKYISHLKKVIRKVIEVQGLPSGY